MLVECTVDAFAAGENFESAVTRQVEPKDICEGESDWTDALGHYDGIEAARHEAARRNRPCRTAAPDIAVDRRRGGGASDVRSKIGERREHGRHRLDKFRISSARSTRARKPRDPFLGFRSGCCHKRAGE